MRSFRICTLFIAIGLSSLNAQTNTSAPATTATAMSEQDKTIEKHAKPILDALNLNDAEKEAKVRSIIGDYFKTLDAWHAENDEQIKALWKQFNSARGKQDEANADAALAKVDGIYASFKPQHDRFLSSLSSVLTPEQIETVKDVLTIN